MSSLFQNLFARIGLGCFLEFAVKGTVPPINGLQYVLGGDGSIDLRDNRSTKLFQLSQFFSALE
jgi:hypothetical protein